MHIYIYIYIYIYVCVCVCVCMEKKMFLLILYFKNRSDPDGNISMADLGSTSKITLETISM